MSDPAAIEVRGLTVGYGGPAVIRSVDLTIERGDYVGIIGPNGGGKTTLLRAILGFLQPSEGQVLIFGEPPRRGRRHVGYVPQLASFDRDYPISVADAVLMGRRSLRGMVPWYHREDREAVERALEQVGLADRRGALLGQLSGGQVQRALIARALVSGPRVLLLDEPTASVDPRTEENIYDLLAQLNTSITIALVTHDIGIISSHVKHIACLNRTLVSHGGPTLNAEMLEQTYQCPVDLIAHGVPHRVLAHHGDHAHHGHGDHDDRG